MNHLMILTFSLVLIEILILQEWGTPILSKLLYWTTLQKNRAWVNENPSWQKQYALAPAWMSRVFGAILVILLITSLALGRFDLMLLLHFSSLGFFVLHFMVFDFIRNKIIASTVPERGVRSAQLVPRHYGHYISVPAFAVTSAIAIFSLIRWFFIRSANSTLESGFYFAVLVSAFLSVDWVIRRKPVMDSAEWSEQFRRIEAIGAFYVCTGTALLSLAHSFIYSEENSHLFLMSFFSAVPVLSLFGLLISPPFRKFFQLLKNNSGA